MKSAQTSQDDSKRREGVSSGYCKSISRGEVDVGKQVKMGATYILLKLNEGRLLKQDLSSI